MSKQIVITGMHRSGTSLVASMIQKAGLNIGDQLQGSSRGNLPGHFEDSDFYNFHEQVLKERDKTFLVESSEYVNEMKDYEVKKAQLLIEQRQDKQIWGWKDPRTALFLNFWHNLLPNPYYVLLYRHPLEVALSLLRRATDVEIFLDPSATLRSWVAYNQNILTFYHAHPELCLLCHIGTVTRDIEGFINLLAKKFRLALHAGDVSSVYHPQELNLGLIPPEGDKLLDQIFPEVAAIYRQLESVAHLPSTPIAPSSEYDHQPHLSELIQTAARVASATPKDVANREALTGLKRDELLFSLLQALDPHAIRVFTFALREIFARQLDQVEQPEAQTQVQTTRIRQLEAQTQDQTARIRQLEVQTQDQTARIRQLEDQTYDQETKIHRLDSTLNNIYQTRVWKLARRYWGVKEKTKTKIKGLLPMRWRRSTRLLSEKMLSRVSSPPASPTGLVPDLPRSGKYDIICFPLIDWEFRFQRPQQLLTHFAEHDHRIFYLRSQFNSLYATSEINLTQIAPLVYGLQMPGYTQLNIYQDKLDQTVLAACLESFENFRRAHAIVEAVCLVQLPFWEPLAHALRTRYGWKMVYDCMDDHSGFTGSSPAMLQLEENLIRNSHLVIVTARRLYEKLQTAHPLLIPNGTDYDHFNHLPTSGKLRTRFARPIIGYYGAISDWFDAASVAYAAAQRPHWNFVLIGHTFGSDQKLLTGQPNIHLLGEVPYPELPAYLADFDVCTIPFLRLPLTEATHPVKFFEYISSGKAVVATNLPELEPYADIAYLYQTKEEFLICLERALAEHDPVLIEKRQTIAIANTWEDRYNLLHAAIRNLYGKASIIIVSYDNLDYLRQCLESILAKTIYPNYEVIVVDNNSQAAVKRYLAQMSQQYPEIKVIFNEQNTGFAAANNRGLADCSDSEFVVLLNNDVVVARGWLTKLLKHLQDSAIGMVGPVTNWTGNEAKIDVPYLHPKHMEPFAEAYTQAHEGQFFDIKSLAMYCVAMRRQIFEEVGPLDEQFGVGMFEDDDYAIRVKQTGRRVVCAEDVYVHHYGMASFSKLRDEQYQQLFERNKQLYEAKWGHWKPHQYRQEGYTK